MKLTAYLFIILTGLVSASGVETNCFCSGPARVPLLELYTSEGCSSCPPAEAWLNRLKDSPMLWRDVVPVAFHVEYWDNLGWRDPWASAEFSQRQRDYAQQWRAENIYTPEFVLNGAEWGNWHGLRGVPGSTDEKAGTLEISSTNNALWRVAFTPISGTGSRYEIHAALLVSGLSSDVKAGENKGRNLQHEFVVVELVSIGLTASNAVAHGKFFIPYARHTTEKTLAIAAWITAAGEMTPLQATGGWLVRPAEK